MASVTLENLTFSYPFAEQPALREVSLAVRCGEFVVLAGADGAGKSSVCYAVSGLIPHFFKGEMNGQILVDGVATQDKALQDIVLHVGIAFQNPYNQFSHTKSTVYEELACTMENFGFPPEVMRERVENTLEQTDIAYLKDRNPNTLSGGQAQRVALASVLVLQPKILVLDEPTSQLDPHSSRMILELLKTINRSGITVIMATHDLEGVIECADRIVILDNGQIVQDNSPRLTISWLLTHNPGILIPRIITVTRQAHAMGLWYGKKPAVTLDEAAEGFWKWQQRSA